MSSLLAALRKLAAFRRQLPSIAANAVEAPAITWETVESVQENGYAIVQGKPLASTGMKTFEENERVPVTWKDGKPQVILGHRWRRAQFGQTFRIAGHGIVEELLIGNFDDLGDDVWYRNFDRLEKLGVAEKCNGRLLEVRWGYDGKSFVVKAGDGWYSIFTIDRDPTTVEETWEPKFTWAGQPLKDTSQILSIQSTSSHRYKDVYGRAVENINNSYEDRGSGPQWYENSYGGAFENEEESGGNASGSAFRTFSLVQLLAGQSDGGIGTESAQVLDWYLDGDGKLKFVISVSFDHFTISSPNGSGFRYFLHWVSGDNETDGYEYTTDTPISSFGASATIGATKQDLTTVSETHFFIYDANGKLVEFSSFLGSSQLGQEASESTFGGRIDKIDTVNAPTIPPYRSHAIYYYSGAEQGGGPPIYKDVAMPPSGTFLIGNVSCQLFSGVLGFVIGPWKNLVTTPGGTGSGAALLSRTDFHWSDIYSTGVDVRLWHYTVQYAKPFQLNTDPRLFLVMERYPFVPGTGYINDIPQIGVFVLNARTGAVVKTLRAFQFGLAGASLVGGNAHRIVWTLSSPWFQPQTVYYATNILTGKETGFSPAQVEKLLETQMGYLQPDFLWDREDPNNFYLPDKLPDIEGDVVLEDLGKLVILSGSETGNIRAANNEEILSPLDRYLAS